MFSFCSAVVVRRGGGLSASSFVTPRHACAAKELSDCSWTYIYSVCKKNPKLKKYSLSEVHFNTGRLLFQFNGLQYNL